jgi:hypothetical protein
MERSAFQSQGLERLERWNGQYSKAQPMKVRYGLELVTAILLAVQSYGIEAEPVSCFDRVTEYASKLDAMFVAERNSIIPYKQLNKSVFPLDRCNIREVLMVLSNSRFFQTAELKIGGRYVIALSNGNIKVGFAFVEDRSTTELDYVKVNK